MAEGGENRIGGLLVRLRSRGGLERSFDAQFLEDVGGSLHQLGAFTDQAVAALGHGGMDRTGNGEHFPPLLGGQPRRYEGAALERGFHHQNSPGKSGDDPVAAGKVGGERRGAEGKFGNDQAFFGDGQCQIAVAGRVDAIDTGADDRQGRSGPGQGTSVGGGVDSQGQSADDGQAVAGQGRGEGCCRSDAPGGGVAAADDGYTRPRQQAGIAPQIKYRGRVGDLEEGRGIVGVGEGEDGMPGLLAPGQSGVNGGGDFGIEEEVGAFADHAADGKAAGGKDLLG